MPFDKPPPVFCLNASRQGPALFLYGFFADLCIYIWPGHGTMRTYREIRKTITIEERW